MKRRISLVIALVLSFLMMFSPIARAEDIKVTIPAQTSESADLEIVIKVPPVKTNAVYPQPQEKASVRAFSEGEPNEVHSRQACSFLCSTGAWGYIVGNSCIDCDSIAGK